MSEGISAAAAQHRALAGQRLERQRQGHSKTHDTSSACGEKYDCLHLMLSMADWVPQKTLT